MEAPYKDRRKLLSFQGLKIVRSLWSRCTWVPRTIVVPFYRPKRGRNLVHAWVMMKSIRLTHIKSVVPLLSCTCCLDHSRVSSCMGTYSSSEGVLIQIGIRNLAIIQHIVSSECSNHLHKSMASTFQLCPSRLSQQLRRGRKSLMRFLSIPVYFRILWPVWILSHEHWLFE